MAIPDPKKWNIGYGYIDETTGMIRGRIRWPDGRPPPPFGCRWCGWQQGGHGAWNYLPRGRSHSFTRPTDAQIKARMLARRRYRPKGGW